MNSVGLYLRLSKDDEQAGESVSIENQRTLLKNYVSTKGWDIVDEYIDDGYSGTNFNRPEVMRLLDDAKIGKINTIIVKDLSRFGRNYIEVGQYVDYIFPTYKIRFIAIADNVDTADRNSSGMEMMPIMNVFNEWHAANTSKKNRAVFEANARAGKYMACIAPYGYVAGNDEKRLPIIDEPAASHVRRIFEMRSQGISPNKIAQIFNNEKIMIPLDYRRQKFGRGSKKTYKHYWTIETIKGILNNPIYTGDLVQRRETTISYKNKKHYVRDESEWIRIQNTHEAIISRELWDAVRSIEKSVSQGKSTKGGLVLPLSGLLYCKDCGSKMQLKRTKKQRVNGSIYVNERYVCGAHSRTGQSCCTTHSIRRELVEKIVIDDLKSKLKYVQQDEELAKEYFIKEKTKHDRRMQIEYEIGQYQNRICKLDVLIQSLYEDKISGKISPEICYDLLKKYQEEKQEIERRVKEQENIKNRIKKKENEVLEFIKILRKNVNIENLSRMICLNLIHSVEIG